LSSRNERPYGAFVGLERSRRTTPIGRRSGVQRPNPTCHPERAERVEGSALTERRETLFVGQDVDLEGTHQAEQIRLASETAHCEPQVRGVCRELPEGGIDGDPALQEDLRPGVVVELPVEIRETRGHACRN